MSLVQRFLIGILLGIFVVSIPISLSDLGQLNVAHYLAAVIGVFLVSMMYQFWGHHFLNTLSNLLNSFGA